MPLPQNRLLSGLSPDDLTLLRPYLEPVRVDRDQNLDRPHEEIEHIYFLDSGVASVIAIGPHSRKIEVGPFGREGMSGLPVVLGSDRSPHETLVQVPGEARRIASDALRHVTQRSASLQARLLCYVEAFSVQTAHTLLANGLLTIEQRLARWLLMADDRIDGDNLPLTHEFMALMLAVRRPGVTVAVQMIEGRGLIRATRGVVKILDREGLKDLAHSSYGVPEAEYARLLGP